MRGKRVRQEEGAVDHFLPKGIKERRKKTEDKMEVNTYLSNTIQEAGHKARYDT